MALVILGVDIRQPFRLKNYFLVYTLGLLGLGSELLLGAGAGKVEQDLLVYVVVFLGVYTVASLPSTQRQVSHREPRPGGIGQAVYLLKLVVAANFVLVLLPQLYQYGVRGFYSGQGLADLIGNYGKASVAGGFTVIVSELLAGLTTAAVALYVQRCIESKAHIRYRILVVVLIVTPLVLLQRSLVLFGAVTIAAIYSIEKRYGVARVRRHRRRGVLPILAVLLAFGAAFYIGNLRQTRLVPAGGRVAKQGTVTGDLLRSEFSPAVAYNDIKTHAAELGRPHGAPILGALLTRFVPRAWLPSKPQTSTAYYMTRLRPGPFAAGFVIAPSVYGVMYLNFGRPGCALVVALIALVAARLDVAYVRRRLAILPVYVIVLSTFYSLMRDDLSNSLARVLVAVLVYSYLARGARSPRVKLVSSDAAARLRSGRSAGREPGLRLS